MGACASQPAVVDGPRQAAGGKGNHVNVDTSRASPADSAADIHDSGAALDVAQPQPQQAGTQVPPILADAGRSPAQQSPPASPADQEPEEKLAEEFSAADADAGQEEISPAQGADFTQEQKQRYAEQDLAGVPYNVYERGPPLPPCNKERIQYMKSLGTCFDVPPDPQVEHVITLLCQVFQTSSALMALVESDRIYIRNAQGFQRGDFPWRWSFCAWSLAPPSPETLVIEDATQDARFKDNKMVLEHGVRFYCGTPLIGSNGHRLGTLCFVDSKPRKMEAHNCMILNNMAEMVVRELERDAAQQAAKKQSDAGLLRVLDCFNQGVCFVDTSTAKWQGMHCNSALSEEADVTQDRFVTTPFWELFEMPFAEGARPWEACRDVASRGGEFVVHGVRVAGKYERGSFTMRFRPAGKDVLDENTPLVGVPAVAKHNPLARVNFYFALVSRELAGPISSASGPLSFPSTPSLGGEGRSNLMPDVIPFDDLELGPLLGKGSFGRVYRGFWEGQNVAVKICSSPPTSRSGANYVPAWKSVEAVLGLRLEHPNIVRTFKHSTVLVQGEELLPMWSPANFGGMKSGDLDGTPTSPALSGSQVTSVGSIVSERSEAEVETWMILEYCDKGSLQYGCKLKNTQLQTRPLLKRVDEQLRGGIDRGWFRHPRSTKDGKPHLPSILAIAADIASAMTYLHSAGIVHGDLCGGNILLASDDAASPHGFSAKIADFGMSREMQVASRIETTTYGTVTHMPPELLSDGKLSRAADVYSFGVILNEMFCGVRAWASMTPPQILHAVAVEGRKPKFLDGAPADFMALANACMDADPTRRPTFAEIEPMLTALRREYR